jgi:hypothetical protein
VKLSDELTRQIPGAKRFETGITEGPPLDQSGVKCGFVRMSDLGGCDCRVRDSSRATNSENVELFFSAQNLQKFPL